MHRKMIFIITAAVALTTWAAAKPGTWGKEIAEKNQPKTPAVQFNRWLNEFSSAYEQRDGEKMDELIKQFGEARQEFPAAPRLDIWMKNIKEAYDQQDVGKMGRLLDNAQQMRQRMKERFLYNRGRFRGQSTPQMRFEGRRMRDLESRFGRRAPESLQNPDERPMQPQGNLNIERPRGFNRRAGIGEDRRFERQFPDNSFEAKRPMRQGAGPDRLAPLDGPRFQRQQQQRYGRPDLGPGPQGRGNPRFNRPIRPEFEQQFYDDQEFRRPMRQQERSSPDDFWE